MGRSRVRAGVVLGPLSLLVLTAAIIHGAGGQGFSAFLNIEALLFVVLGTLLLVWAAYPTRRWRESEVAAYASQCAMAMGWLGTLLGMILLLSAGDMSVAPRRMALALNALFFGLLLSKGLFMTLSRRQARGTVRLPREVAV